MSGNPAPARPARGWVPPLPALLAALLSLGYIVALAPLLPVATDDLGIVGVFSTDEALSGQIVRQMVEGRTLSPQHFFSYGALYHELAALLLLPLAPWGVDGQVAVIALRAVSLVAGAATIWLTYLLGARLAGRVLGAVAALLVAVSAELAGWSVTAHPDTLQLALLTGAVLAVCHVRADPRRRTVGMAAALAGLAFATKYAGLLVMPLLALAATAALLQQGRRGRALVRELLIDGTLVAAIFGAVFVLTNPYALIEWRRFVTQARAEFAHAREGHVVTGEGGAIGWLRLAAARSFGGWLLLPAALAGWLLALLDAPRGATTAGDAVGRMAARLSEPVIVGLWAFGYLAYLMLAVGYQTPRYALPVLPALAVLAVYLLAQMRRSRPTTAIGATALVAGLAVVAAAGPFADLYSERAARADELDGNPRVAAGRWLGANVAADAAVVSDAYVYIPPGVHNATQTFGLTEGQVALLRPVAIVVNDDIRDRFRDPGGAAHYVDGEAAYQQRAAAYASLEAGELDCYALVMDFGGVRVYAERDALARGTKNGC